MRLEGENAMSSETENSSQTTEDKIGADKGVPAQPRTAIPGDNPYRAIEVEIQGRFNELRREYLADRETNINRWIAIIALVLTIIGYWGWSRLSDIEKKAREHLEAIEKTRTRVEQAEKDIQSTTAKIAADHPDKMDQAVERIRENPEASLITKAIADAVSLQRQGKIGDAIEMWRAIALVGEQSDKEIAARAAFSVGYLVKEKNPKDDTAAEESIAAYDRAIRLKPDFVEAYNRRGITKGELDRHEDALADFDQAICLEPDSPYLYSNRGNMKLKSGHCDGAIADLEKALSLFGRDDPEARMELEQARNKCGES